MGVIGKLCAGLCAVFVAAALLFGCAANEPRRPNFAAVTEVNAAAVVAVGDNAILGNWTGTGWYIATDGNNSVIATAGHVCAARGDLISGFATVVLAVYSTEEADAYQIYDHDTDPDDVCLLYSPVAAPDVIRIGADPNSGDPVSYVGYPNGMLGAFNGTLIGQEETQGFLIASIPAYYGASGSAVLNERGEAIGLLSKGDMEFTNRAWLVPTERLRAARDYANAFLRRLRDQPFQTSRGVLVGDIDRDHGQVN